MKKLLLLVICAFALMVSLLFLLQRKPPSKSKVAFLKKVAKKQLIAAGSLQTGAYAHRLYLYEDSLFLLAEDQQIISTDTGLHGIYRQPIPFKPGNNTLWYFNKEKDVRSYLLYPSGNIVQYKDGKIDSFSQRMVVNNCVNTSNMFWGQTSDSTDTKLFITAFNMQGKTTHPQFDLHEIFSRVKGFSRDCFSACMDGSFLRISDSSFLFYNYYSSYFVQFNNNRYALYTGIDSMPLRAFKKISTTVGDYKIEKCVSDNENFVHISGCSDGRFVYMLSNISRKELNAQRLIDVYDASGMRYHSSFLIPDRVGHKPVDITTGVASSSLYILYGNNELVKYTKPL